MRVRLVVIGVFAIGCTMNNPAFEGGGGSDGTGDGDVETTAETGTTTPDTSDPGLCPLQPGKTLEIDLGPPGCTGDQDDTFSIYRVVASIDGSIINAYGCDSTTDCSNCQAGPNDVTFPMKFGPLQLDGIADPATCVHIIAHRLDPADPDSCQFQTVMIETVPISSPRMPLLLGSNTPGVMLPMRDVGSGIAEFDPMLTVDEQCSCVEYPDECCNGMPTTAFGYDIGDGQIVPLGGHTSIVTSNQVTYEFSALDGYQSGMCSEPLRASWGLVLKP